MSIIFQNDPCTGSGNRNGICYTCEFLKLLCRFKATLYYIRYPVLMYSIYTWPCLDEMMKYYSCCAAPDYRATW